MDKEIIVYTSIIKNYDKLQRVKSFPNVRYVCYTDNPDIEDNGWEIIKNRYQNICPNMTAKHPKILPHLYFPNNEYSIWLDGNISINTDPNIIVEKYISDYVMAVHSHPRRDCVYEEYKIVADMQNVRPEYNSKLLQRQITTYSNMGLVPHSKLWECGILIRKHNHKRVVDFMTKWWDEINKYTVQDQISFGFLMWQRPLLLNTIPKNLRENSDYKYVNYH